MKDLTYETKWIEYPDIAPLCHQLELDTASPMHTDIHDGKPHYTLPIMHDPSTHTTVADSFKIAQYLDRTYPPSSSPSSTKNIQLLPKGTIALQLAFLQYFTEKVTMPMFPILALPTKLSLPPRSQEYYRATREQMFGMRIEDIAPEGSPQRSEYWKLALEGLNQIHEWTKLNDGISDQDPGKWQYVMGEKPGFSDVMMAAQLIWVRRLLGRESKEWKDVMCISGGRWAWLMEEFAEWDRVDANESE